jgi:hypothetical protein
MKKLMISSVLLIATMTFIAKVETKAETKVERKTKKNIKSNQVQIIDKTDELFAAVEKGKKSLIKSLLKSKSYKIEINKLNKNKNTVLDIAVDKQYTKIAGILLEYGAKVTTETRAYGLQRMFNLRATKFFLGGILMWPLWFGSAFAWNNIKSVKELVL